MVFFSVMKTVSLHLTANNIHAMGGAIFKWTKPGKSSPG